MNNKKIYISIMLLIGVIIFSGCINPFSQVPVVKIQLNLMDNKSQGTVDIVNYNITQGFVSYIDRPKKIYADSFPAIAARQTMTKGKDFIIGPWEMTNYTGSGDYSLNIGFRDNNYPVSGDSLHITVMIVDKDGTKIGYLIDNYKWE